MYDGSQVGRKITKNTTSDWNKSKGNNFIDFYTKQRSWVPPPNNYKRVQDGYFEKV
jgi:hypothetical protein